MYFRHARSEPVNVFNLLCLRRPFFSKGHKRVYINDGGVFMGNYFYGIISLY